MKLCYASDFDSLDEWVYSQLLACVYVEASFWDWFCGLESLSYTPENVVKHLSSLSLNALYRNFIIKRNMAGFVGYFTNLNLSIVMHCFKIAVSSSTNAQLLVICRLLVASWVIIFPSCALFFAGFLGLERFWNPETNLSCTSFSFPLLLNVLQNCKSFFLYWDLSLQILVLNYVVFIIRVRIKLWFIMSSK